MTDNPAFMSDEELAAKVSSGEIDLLFRSNPEVMELARRLERREREIAELDRYTKAIENLPPIARLLRGIE